MGFIQVVIGLDNKFITEVILRNQVITVTIFLTHIYIPSVFGGSFYKKMGKPYQQVPSFLSLVFKRTTAIDLFSTNQPVKNYTGIAAATFFTKSFLKILPDDALGIASVKTTRLIRL